MYHTKSVFLGTVVGVQGGNRVRKKENKTGEKKRS